LDDSAHENIERAAGAEAGWLFFDNVDVASVLDELNFVEMCREAKVSPKRRTRIDVFYKVCSAHVAVRKLAVIWSSE